jgi:MFS family permease
MQSAAAGWFMTNLDARPFIVSLVQVAVSLPMFVFAIPAGALGDIFDRRKIIVVAQSALIVLVGGFVVLIRLNLVTTQLLLAFMFLAASAAAVVMPVWQSIVPQLVPKTLLHPAVALNSVGVNVSRAVGPSLAGIIIAGWGMAAPFRLSAVTNIAVIAALVWWRPQETDSRSNAPAERLFLAIGAGLRYARHNPHVRAAQIRAMGFFVFASAYWALLPLVARDQVSGGPSLYGLLLGAIGVGAVSGAGALPFLQQRMSADRIVSTGAMGTFVALVLFAVARHPATACAASLVAGLSWIIVLSTLNVSVQVALPNWVRSRGLSIYNTVMFGSMTAWQRNLGRNRFICWLAGRPSVCRLWRHGSGPAPPALEAPDRRRARPNTFRALACTCDN